VLPDALFEQAVRALPDPLTVTTPCSVRSANTSVLSESFFAAGRIFEKSAGEPSGATR
jgi:hypothetical protein